MSDNVEETVRTLVAAAGLAPSDDEVAILVAGYPGFRAGIDALYAIPEARYAAPALIFSATPVFAEWSEVSR